VKAGAAATSTITVAPVNAFTGEVNQLTYSQSSNYSPSIDGAGPHVAFQGTVSGYSQIFIVTQTSSAATTTGLGGGGRPRPM